MRGSQFTLFGGNSNNRAHYGAFYCNLNNLVSNTDWNNEAAHIYLDTEISQNAQYYPLPLEKINPKQATASSVSNVVEEIRHEKL